MVKSRERKGKRALAGTGRRCYICQSMTTTETKTPAETIAAGCALARSLSPGSCVALSGELGAGKTHFVRGMLEGWGGAEAATSPTFTLVHEYATPRGPIFHLDFYRAQSTEEIWGAAHDELEAPHGLVVMEWADRFPALIPPDAVRVHIAHHGEGHRHITIEP